MIKRIVGAAVFTFILAACGLAKDPTVVQDFSDVVTCVLAHSTSATDILTNCSQYALAEIEAVINYLLSDSAFRSQHPEMIPVLEQRLIEVKAALAAEKADAGQ